MKNILIILLAIGVALQFYAQNETEKLKRVATSFEEKFNKNDFQAVFVMFLSELKKEERLY